MTAQVWIFVFLGVAIGTVCPRLLFQWLLGPRNSGAVWYLAQIALGCLIGAVTRFAPGLGAGVVLGIFSQMIFQAFATVSMILEARRLGRLLRGSARMMGGVGGKI